MAQNSNFTSNVATAQTMGKEEVNALLDKYPNSKNAFVALLLLVEAEKESGVAVCDWECDLAEIVWKEVQ